MVAVAWLLAVLCVSCVTTAVPGGLQQQQEGQQQLSWLSLQTQQLRQHLGHPQKHMRSAWAAVAANPGDVGLAAVVVLPYLLLVLLVASAVLRRQRGGAVNSIANTPSPAAHNSAPTTMQHPTASSKGAALFLAVAKLLPVSCALAGRCLGLSHASDAVIMLLRHPLACILAAAFTLLSQVRHRS